MISPVRAIAIFLVVMGTLLLLTALTHRNYLCGRGQSRTRKGWKTLFTLVLLFILGYLVFTWEIIMSPVIATEHLVVAFIFFGGGIFVALVVRMSRNTVDNIQQVADLDRHKSLHDSLTGLPNRLLLQERMEQAILHARRDMSTVAVILLDLNRFKDINDTLGHAVGDHLLRELAPRLQSCIRDIDTVARIGGDEFAMVLPAAPEQAVTAIAEKLARTIDQVFHIDDNNLSVGVSMGIAIYPHHGDSAQLLLQHADAAMYKAKRNAVDFCIYDIADNEYSAQRLKLVTLVREAVKDRAFRLAYQPIINISDGSVSFVEALLRWQDHQRDDIKPDRFIPVIEHIGLIKEITTWTIEQGLKQRNTWMEQGFDTRIAINISARILADTHLAEEIATLLSTTGTPADRLVLEITETGVMHQSENTLQQLQQLKQMGTGLSIDDFGTGQSSLFYLKNIPASMIKIDGSIIQNMRRGSIEVEVVQTIIELAHRLDLKIIAEGVEDREDCELVGTWGCDMAQGFYHSKPLTAHELYRYAITSRPRNMNN